MAEARDLRDDEVAIEVEAASVDLLAGVPVGRAAVGRVVGAAPSATHLVGARVLAGEHQPCGECDLCRRGGAALCPVGRTLGEPPPGALAKVIVARARWALPLAGELDVPGPAAALLGGPAALAYALYARAGVGPREPAVIVGDGPVARLLVDVLVAKGAPPAVVTADAALAAWATGRGADAVARVAGDAVDAVDAAIRAATAARGHGDRPWKLFETDGDPARAALALRLAGPRATVALVAPSPGAAAPVDLAGAIAREVTILGVRGAHPDLLPEVVALAVRGDLDLAAAADVVTAADLAAAVARPGARAVVVSS